jgi:hypothetical protein
MIQPNEQVEIEESGIDETFQSKINHACKVFEECLDNYKNPAILCSFGKDSVLMLWMLREWYSKDIPVIFLRHPWMPRKNSYADNLISEWNLQVHSAIPPLGISVCSKLGKTEAVQHFSLGQRTLVMPIGKQKIEGREEWICGAERILRGPFGTYDWPWDVAFCGHKSSDTDPVQGNVPLDCDINKIHGSCDLAYPLRHFTDEDVWNCFRKWNIPFNRLRYVSLEEPQDDIENTFNGDYHPYCMKCFDPLEGSSVQCPKTGLQITNISGSINQIDPQPKYCKPK